MKIWELIREWAEKTIEAFKNILAPEDRRVERLLKLEQSILFELLPRSPVRIKNIGVLFDYQNKIVRLIVKSIKYKNHPDLRKRVAGYLYDEIVEMSSEISMFEGSPPLLVPMPMSKKEKQKKGFNQCEELLREIEKLSEGETEVSYKALKKIRETARQTTLSRSERMINVRQSMMADRSAVGHRTIIVLDDVYTTLSSFREAERALLASGAKRVYGLFIAH